MSGEAPGEPGVNEGAPDGGTATAEGAVRVTVGDGTTLALPPEATDGEAAAIVAAVGAHLTDLDRAAAAEAEAAAETDDGDRWTGRRWAFAGRTDAVGGRAARPTEGTPTDPWTAAGRADRL